MNPSIGTIIEKEKQFLDLRNGANFQLNWNSSIRYYSYSSLSTDVLTEYEKEYKEHSDVINPRIAFDPYIFDLKNAIYLIEQYGKKLNFRAPCVIFIFVEFVNRHFRDCG